MHGENKMSAIDKALRSIFHCNSIYCYYFVLYDSEDFYTIS